MTVKYRVLNQLATENKLKEYDVIDADNISFHLKYGKNIITHDKVPTLTTKCGGLLVVTRWIWIN